MALTDVKVRTIKPGDKPVKLSDGDGMHLLVHPNGSKYWRLQYRFNGKQKMLALGVFPEVSLADARQQRDAARKLIAAGVDPSEQKKIDKAEQQYEEITFEVVARAWHTENKKWSELHRERILKGLEEHLFPAIGKIHIASLKTKDLLAPIKAVANSGRLEVAMRLKQRTTAIMTYAVQNGIIDYNPAQDMAGAILPGKVKHRPALPLNRLSELLKRIDEYKGREFTKWAIMLNLLLFIRSSELRFGRWQEVDFDTAMWLIPPVRQPIPGVKFSERGSKMHTPHLVPLSRQALELLRNVHRVSGGCELIFIGDHSAKKPLSEGTVNKALQNMGYDTKTDICCHGFRTMACSSLIESGLWSRDAVERQMSHQERNGVRAAYIHKAEHLEERRLMLQWWADFLDANREECISPFEYAKVNNPLKR
ncbi:tyrosine-type recombinase/integrase [Escherichia coli]|uniref:tyrosine-type recombinase/integrase n=1 Tax=Escherichia coli TaxID=562 RepID=UPI000986A468|nr:integrase arm-type DNA-binding domain-containing protein [Escherichia coli]MCH6494371.1 integrase arm-type DNA-binding domain-containing protein [Escherichia coli]OOJ74212.1 integrase [Escherichia coli]